MSIVTIQKSTERVVQAIVHLLKFSKSLRGDTQNQSENQKKRQSWVEENTTF